MMDFTNESQQSAGSPLESDKIAQLLKQMQRVSSPGYLPTIRLSELYDQAYQGRSPVVDGLLYSGTYLFAGAPKVGKSFLLAHLPAHCTTLETKLSPRF